MKQTMDLLIYCQTCLIVKGHRITLPCGATIRPHPLTTLPFSEDLVDRWTVCEKHLTTATVFFKGTSKTVQNELLDCMLSVIKDYILEEVKNIQADETTEISTHCQLVPVLQYIDKKNNSFRLQRQAV